MKIEWGFDKDANAWKLRLDGVYQGGIYRKGDKWTLGHYTRNRYGAPPAGLNFDELKVWLQTCARMNPRAAGQLPTRP